jgi:hypothetical protein
MSDKNKKPDNNNEEEQFPGYPEYPASEDIMNRQNRDKETDINIDDVTGSFRHNSELPAKKPQRSHNKEEQTESWKEDKTGDDLDVPGADLDDAEEAIGEEDEENNLYSLGGDRHEDLEEDNGEFPDFDEENS